jgi:hypothetical protein
MLKLFCAIALVLVASRVGLTGKFCGERELRSSLEVVAEGLAKRGVQA